MTRSISRRRVLGRAILGALAAGVARAAAAEDIKESDKVSKADALYQYQPKGQQRCAICLQFMPPGRCRIVAGPVSPNGWCQFFAARENAR